MLPRPSICLHIPKTGSTWVDWIFNAADWLSLRRSFHSRRLAMPHRASLELVRRIKRHGPAFGNLNCRTGGHLDMPNCRKAFAISRSWPYCATSRAGMPRSTSTIPAS